MHWRAVFADGSVSHDYTAETEKEIRAKIERENQFRKDSNGKIVYVLVEANDTEAIRSAVRANLYRLGVWKL